MGLERRAILGRRPAGGFFDGLFGGSSGPVADLFPRFADVIAHMG